MATVRKRLHISGLTPAITENDIRTRLEKFIDVETIDEFGKLNALGEPRKFAYATVDATEQNLARCLNLLSGTVWKGAKLRIGEAKPDYTQRLKIEKERQEIGTSKKRPRLPRGVQGVHGKDMSPVSLANVDSRPGWHKTTLLHLIRPMKMRPSRPLPILPSKLPSKTKTKSKSRRKALHALTRAKVQRIDPRLWNPVHVTENMLQSVIIAPSALDIPTAAPVPTTSESPSLDDESSTTSADEPMIPTTKVKVSSPQIPKEMPTSPAAKTATEYAIDQDIRQENSLHLELLSNMFGESSDDWNGRETVQDDPSGSEDADGIKAVKSHKETPSSDNVARAIEGESQNLVEDIVMKDAHEPESSKPSENRQMAPSPTSNRPTEIHGSKEKSLKDLFKPQEDTNFSLMAGLDLDLDLELELDSAFDLTKPTETLPHSSGQTDSIAQPSTSVYHYEGLKLDPSLPLFFPQPDDPRSKDIISTAKAQGWQFYRTDDSETIHKRWDEIKGGLTHEWKKRSREAVKARKRRFGAEAMEEP